MGGVEHRKRVLHAMTVFAPLSETFIADRMVELERLGWEAWLATQGLLNRDAFPFPPDERMIVPAPRPLTRRVSERLRRIPRAERMSAWWVEPAIAAVRPAVVHAHFGWSAIEVLPAVRRAGLPLVAGFHGYDLTVAPASVDYSALFREVDRVLVVSRFLEGKLRALGYEGRVDVIPSGVRLSGFPFAGARSPASGRLLFVGRMVPYKGLDVLLRALPAVRASIPGLRLEVIGDGPIRGEAEALASELGLASFVAFRGALPHAQVSAAMREADLLVVPSRTADSGQAEGLCNVTKEAFAIGTQVVATANGGIPETIPPGQRHELVGENDPGALAQRILDLWDRRPEWPARARGGRAWVEQTFDWSRLAPRIATVYDELVDERAAS